MGVAGYMQGHLGKNITYLVYTVTPVLSSQLSGDLLTQVICQQRLKLLEIVSFEDGCLLQVGCLTEMTAKPSFDCNSVYT